MSFKRKVITVDGLAGSGKTTLSRELAKRLGFAHLNSGALYRAIAYLALKKGVDLESGPQIAQLLDHHRIELKMVQGNSTVLLDDLLLGEEIRSPEVSQATSLISCHAEVRAALKQLQREAYEGFGLVAEGRDMGTVIFPDADLKFFIETAPGVRLERRLAELKHAAGEGDYKGLKAQMGIEITERDERDRNRVESPTVPAPDAVIVDNNLAKLTEVVQSMYDCAFRKQLFNKGS